MIEQLIASLAQQKKFDIVTRWNTLQPPWHESGWPLALPNIEFTDRTRLVLHFQDRITPTDTGCAELAQIEWTYSNRAHQVIVIFYSHGLNHRYKGPVQLVEYSTHNWFTVTDLQRVADQWQQAVQQPKTQAWQCLNGRICDHRRRVARVLSSWPHGTLSLGTDIPLPSWHYGTYPGTENWQNFLRLLPLYQSTAINIVTETDYNARPGVICEKTLYAFVAGQVPIIVAHPGAVQDCRNMGFDMLDDLVDHSYDWLPNEQRAEAALELNRDLILGHRDIRSWQRRITNNQLYVQQGFLTWMQTRAEQDLARVF